jgi:gingipain R
MKRNLILLFLLIGGTFLFAANGFNVSFNQPSFGEYELNFNLDDYRLDETRQNGVTYSTIDFEGSVVTTEEGYAELPFIHATVQLSAQNNVSLEVISSDYVDYDLAYPLLPSRGIIYRNQDPAMIPYKIDQASIVDDFFPANLAEATEPFVLRSVRGTNVYVYPFQYNASRNVLRVYTNLTVRLSDNNTTPINPLPISSSRVTREMHFLYNTVFVNYDVSRFEHELGDNGSILVIYTPRDADAIEPWIQWKREKGYTVYTEEVATGTNVTSLVETQYNAHNDILYVQLCGDWADIQGPTSGGAATDPNLGCIVGGDAYPDLIVGRFSANTANDITVQVNKSITYEQTPETGATWYSSAIGIASNQGVGDDNEDDDVHIQNIYDNKLNPFTYDTHTPIYDPSANATAVAAAVNDGASIINYCGHGSMTSWVSSGFSNNHVNMLTNEDRLPFIISVACVNGAFDDGECFAEAWLKKENGGAIGMFAATINQSWDPPMRGQDYVNDLLIGGYDYTQHAGQNGITTDVQKTTYGAMCFNGAILMTVEDYSGGQDEMQHWHVFGDASLQVRTDTPAAASLSNQAVLMGVDFSTIVTANGAPVEGAMVSFYQNDEIFCGLTDATGSVTITHSLVAGDAQITVTGFNVDTIYDVIAVIPPGGAYVLVDDVVIDDSAANNDGMLDYGEAAVLDITLLNVGEDEAANVTATLSSADAYVTITDDNQSFGNITAGGTATENGAFSFEIDSLVPDMYSALFTLEATDGTATWSSTFSIVAHAPVLEMSDFIVDDTANGNGDYFWDAGEAVELVVEILNNGSSDASEVFGELVSNDPYITINTNNISYGDLNSSATANGSFSVSASASTPQAYMAAFMLNINAAGGIIGNGSFQTQIGGYLIDEDFTDWLPENWETTSSSGQVNWAQGIDSNAGGVAPEAQFSWSPSTTGEQRLISKPVNTTGAISLNISFQNTVNDYNGDYELRVETTSDGSTWNTVEIIPSSTVGPQLEEMEITTPDVGSTTFQVAWTFDGNTFNINYWYIDDVILAGAETIPGYIEGNVSLIGGTGSVEDVLIDAGGMTTYPDAMGNYNLGLIPGTYSVIASLEGYILQTIENVEVLEGETTSDIDFVLESDVGSGNDLIPLKTELSGNYPNPFNPTTNISYALKNAGHVTLEIYNIKGEKVTTLINDEMEAGYYTATWEGKNSSNKSVASGIYFAKLRADGRYTSTRKMIMLK